MVSTKAIAARQLALIKLPIMQADQGSSTVCEGGQWICLPVKRRGGWPKGRKRKPEIPGAKPPKAPQTAYVLFLADRRKFYDPRKYSFGEITKLVAAEWNCLAQPQRDVYERRCEQEKNRYRNELQAYRQSHDFQLIMRKKRLKRALSGRNPEDSSDCTDGPE
ncbi:SWI/SNF-related matrix-associated actin-dependent regulator of chromatin subfamily E member 1-related-like, partial [Hyalella azteca]|uniref:SWI/SNF-related matrix-associated actin-dependent regulator of chromatin subfamily E member 1-related-like n=1 Tax=Hyalella azteca TaxID=294128 RepID=A0A8B7P9B6_HYAAZ